MPNTIKPGQRIPGEEELKRLRNEGAVTGEGDIARVGDDIYRRDLTLEQDAMRTYSTAPQTDEEWAAFRKSVYDPEPEGQAEMPSPEGEEQQLLDQREQAGSADTAQGMREDRAEETPTDVDELRRRKEGLQADYLQDLTNEREQEQEVTERRRTNIEDERRDFQEEVAPIREDVVDFAKQQVEALKQIDAEANMARLNQLQETLSGYHSAMNDELDQVENPSSTQSFIQGRKNRVVSNYESKIATANAEAEMIKGNTRFAFDVIDRSSQAIKNTLQTEKDFFNMVYEMETAEMALEFEEFGLSDEEKTQIEGLISDIDKDIARIDANKKTVWSLLESNPKMVNEAGITLTDTEEEIFKKTTRWYAQNPMEQAGPGDWKKTTFNDKDAIFSPSSGDIVYVDGSTDPITGAATDKSKVLSGKSYIYNFTSYAEDSEWGHKMKKHLSDVEGMYTSEQINEYISKNYSKSILKGKGDTLIRVSEKYDIDPTIMLALLQHESRMGSSNVALKNNNFGGVTWNANMPEELKGTPRPSDEGGNYVKFDSVEEGLETQAALIAGRKMEPQEDTPDTNYGKAEKLYMDNPNVGRVEMEDIIKEETGWTEGRVNDFLKEQAIIDIEAEFNKEGTLGPDGKVSPDDYNEKRQQWKQNGFDVQEFDEQFVEYRDPDNKYYQVEGERTEVEPVEIGSDEYWRQAEDIVTEEGKDMSWLIQEEVSGQGTSPELVAKGINIIQPDKYNSGEKILEIMKSSLSDKDYDYAYEVLKRKSKDAGYSGWLGTGDGDIEEYIEKEIIR